MPKRAVRILLVDDDVSVRASVGNVLRAAGYEVVVAPDGRQALEQLRGLTVDLLLLDLGLPVKSGWEVFERIATEHPALPTIIMTGQSNQKFSALAAGVGVLMEKPLDAQSLLHCIEELLAEPTETRARRLQGHGDRFRHIPPAGGSRGADAPA